jgi:hypothetical protein
MQREIQCSLITISPRVTKRFIGTILGDRITNINSKSVGQEVLKILLEPVE